MINSKPNKSDKYHQGLFVPQNPDKIIKLNKDGGLYYRSSWELKLMRYFDLNDKIVRWAAEYVSIPYELTEIMNNGDIRRSTHTYYPDFYYELRRSDGDVAQVVCEVKPYSETIEPKIPMNPTLKQVRNFEYAKKMLNINLHKWNESIDYCRKRGMEFVIATEVYLNNI